jgi:glutaredoxin-related protein
MPSTVTKPTCGFLAKALPLLRLPAGRWPQIIDVHLNQNERQKTNS